MSDKERELWNCWLQSESYKDKAVKISEKSKTVKSEQCKLQLKPSFIPYPRRIGPHADAIATVLHLWLPELLLPSWNPSCLGLWTLFPARLDLVSSVPFENPYFANSVLTFRIFFDILNPFPSHLSLLCCKILLSCIARFSCILVHCWVTLPWYSQYIAVPIVFSS